MEVDLATFDPAQPALFYCKREGVIELADAWVLVDGAELPVHQAVLGMHSNVFLGAYMSERKAPTGDRVRSRGQPRLQDWAPPGPIRLLVGLQGRDVTVL